MELEFDSGKEERWGFLQAAGKVWLKKWLTGGVANFSKMAC
jgi:hypothetical protein